MPTHKKPESERFRGPAKWCQYVVARGLVTLLQRLPLGVAYRLGRAAGWLAWKLMAGRRATVRKNLKIVNAWMEGRAEGGDRLRAEGGELKPDEREEGGDGLRAEGGDLRPEFSCTQPPAPTQVSGLKSHPSLSLEEQVKEVFLRAGANLFCGFSFATMTLERVKAAIHVEGFEHLRDGLSGGRGAIILLAHMGPWEALTQLPGLARAYGVEAPFGAVYRPPNNAYLEAWLKVQRESVGTRLFGSRHKFYAPADFVRGGGMLGVLSDQRASGGERAMYFGLETSVTPLPGLLHLRAKGGLLAVSIETAQPRRWRIRIEPVALPPHRAGERRKAVAEATARAMERALMVSPLDGFWFHDRFKDSRKRRNRA